MQITSGTLSGSSRTRARSFMAQPFKHSASGFYYIRRRVPLELRSALGLEYKRSLKTKDPVEAKARFAKEWCKSEDAFSLARAQLSGTAVLTARDVQQLAARWARCELEKMEAEAQFTDFLIAGSQVVVEHAGGYEEHQVWLSLRQASDEELAVEPIEIVRPHVVETLRAENIPVPRQDSDTFTRLVNAFWEHLLRLSDVAKSRYENNWLHRLQLLEREPLSIQQSRFAGSQVVSISQLFEAYKAAKLLNDGDSRSTRKTLDEFGSTIRRFIELYEDLPVTAVTRAVIQDYRGHLSKFPSKAKGAALLSAPQLIAKAQAEGLPLLTAPTVRNKLRVLSAVLGHGLRMGLVTENVVEASGVAKAAGRKASGGLGQKRKDYSAEELRKIFQSPAFTDQEWGFPRRDYGRAFYWLPLLMYYTGARREELAQLSARDVYMDADGIPCLSILATFGEDDGGRTVKTLGSRRVVPLHDDLIVLGFMVYAKSQPQIGQLFPLLKQNPDGYYGVNWGKAWGAYLRKTVGLTSAASPAHGFRHTFKTLCRQAGIAEDIHDSITGHSDGSVSRKYGVMPLSRIWKELKSYPSCALMSAV